MAAGTAVIIFAEISGNILLMFQQSGTDCESKRFIGLSYRASLPNRETERLGTLLTKPYFANISTMTRIHTILTECLARGS